MPSRAYEASSRTCTCSPFSWACTERERERVASEIFAREPATCLAQPHWRTHLHHGLCRSELSDNMHGSALLPAEHHSGLLGNTLAASRFRGYVCWEC